MDIIEILTIEHNADPSIKNNLGEMPAGKNISYVIKLCKLVLFEDLRQEHSGPHWLHIFSGQHLLLICKVCLKNTQHYIANISNIHGELFLPQNLTDLFIFLILTIMTFIHVRVSL